jgi:hypothetical protein
MAGPNYQLVVQWPAALLDLDRLIDIEDALIACGRDDSEVDDHDYGADEANVFILTDNPRRTFEKLKPVLERECALRGARVAYRKVSESTYAVLWPYDLMEFKVT